jgi:hypothetical protein
MGDTILAVLATSSRVEMPRRTVAFSIDDSSAQNTISSLSRFISSWGPASRTTGD